MTIYRFDTPIPPIATPTTGAAPQEQAPPVQGSSTTLTRTTPPVIAKTAVKLPLHPAGPGTDALQKLPADVIRHNLADFLGRSGQVAVAQASTRSMAVMKTTSELGSAQYNALSGATNDYIAAQERMAELKRGADDAVAAQTAALAAHAQAKENKINAENAPATRRVFSVFKKKAAEPDYAGALKDAAARVNAAAVAITERQALIRGQRDIIRDKAQAVYAAHDDFENHKKSLADKLADKQKQFGPVVEAGPDNAVHGRPVDDWEGAPPPQQAATLAPSTHADDVD